MGRFFFGMTTARKRAGCMEIKLRLASGHPDPGLSFVLYMLASTAQTLNTLRDIVGRDRKTACEPICLHRPSIQTCASKTSMFSSFLGWYVIRGEARGGVRVSHRTDPQPLIGKAERGTKKKGMGRSSLATDSHRSGAAVVPDAITRKRLEKGKMEHLRLRV
ncbi:hypothetical protein M441DRAFT_379701 [Trichoderma asperellum CBS 433.97]|uniref:Uncharacterized protein n=1 Tax=Trichoderma asperellum (strain ATCC 204424 / CBS 433.97 / NBRC 101777) TaxID=1042311 RepID=A0A2T3ZAX3_TRIA4|nr:hypothetical protein M441DRAFT_379701 [Trichoderma asperellum CBS 433.97]PTB41959.1 hypothetical protein M441DRAFT_379701 [Trichoderma asperellum CBS 433.97]